MDADFQNTLKNFQRMLLEDYKPRMSKDSECVCVVCGLKNKPMYFNAITYFQDANLELPNNFVTKSASMGTVRGCFPICSSCLKPCSKCGFAMKNEVFYEIYHKIHTELKKNYYAEGLRLGGGLCQHIYLSVFFHSIFKRIFKIGRFKKK